MPYGVTPEGFKAKPVDVIIEDIVARQRGTIDAGIDTSEHEVFGNLNASIAMSIAEVWEAAEDVHGMLDPDAAEDESLDAVASLTATTREPATYSRVQAQLALTNGTALVSGTHIASVDGNPTARFTPEADFTAPSTGTHNVWFRALATGPVVANSGTLTEIDTPLTGWTSIANAADATLGSNVESDEVMRIRREEELAAQGGGTFDGMRADVLKVPGVTSCTVLENRSDIVDSNGLPPHSFECLVLGGDETDIAVAIWKSKPLGIETFGSVSDTIEDSQGNDQSVRFSRPTEVRIYVAVDPVEIDAALFGVGGYEAIREAIRASAETVGQPGYLGIGTDVIANRLNCAAIDVSGVIDSQTGVALAAIVAPGLGSARITIGPREIATIDTADIYIVWEGV